MARRAVLLALASMALLATSARADAEPAGGKHHGYGGPPQWYPPHYGGPPQYGGGPPPHYGGYSEPSYGGGYDGYGDEPNQGDVPQHLKLELTGVPKKYYNGGGPPPPPPPRAAAPAPAPTATAKLAGVQAEPVPVGGNDSDDDWGDDDDDDKRTASDDFDVDDGEDDDDVDPDDNTRLNGGSYKKKRYNMYCQNPSNLGAYGPYSSYGGHDDGLAEKVPFVGQFKIKYRKQYYKKPYKLWGSVVERVGKVKRIKLKKESYADESFCTKFLNVNTTILPWKVRVYEGVIRPEWSPDVRLVTQAPYYPTGVTFRASIDISNSNTNTNNRAGTTSTGPAPLEVPKDAKGHPVPLPVSVDKATECQRARIITGNVVLCTETPEGRWLLYWGRLTGVAEIKPTYIAQTIFSSSVDIDIDNTNTNTNNGIIPRDGNGYGSYYNPFAGVVLDGMCDNDVPAAVPWKWDLDLHLVTVSQLESILPDWLINKINNIINPKV